MGGCKTGGPRGFLYPLVITSIALQRTPDETPSRAENLVLFHGVRLGKPFSPQARGTHSPAPVMKTAYTRSPVCKAETAATYRFNCCL